jgi:2-methylcitrate dehydratase PrpD
VFDGDGDVDWTQLALGAPWSLESPGLIFKLYPCCGSTHSTIDALLDLRGSGEFDWRSVDRVDALVHPRRLPHVDRPVVRSGLEAKFSLQAAGAITLMFGLPGPQHFSDAQANDPVMHEVARRFVVGELPLSEQTVVPGRDDCYAATVHLRMADGSVTTRHVDAPRGSVPAIPVSDRELEAKFRVAVSEAVSSDFADKLLVELTEAVAGDRSVSRLMQPIRVELAENRIARASLEAGA